MRAIKPVIFIVVGVSLVVGGGWWKIIQLNRKWLIDQRMTWIDVREYVSLVTVDMTNDSGVKMVFPADLVIQTVGNGGSWEIGAMVKLADKEGKIWLADSVANTMGVTYDVVYQDLSWFERIFWWWRIRSADIRTVDLVREDLTDEREAPDGKKFRLISQAWEQKAREYFASRIFMEEKFILRLHNGTEIPGLGFWAARVLENSGLTVFEVVKTDSIESRSRLIFSEEFKNNPSIIWIRQVFDCEVMNRSGDKVDLVIGEDYRKRVWGGD